MNAIDKLQAIFDQITKGLTGTNEEKILQLRENLDLLPLDLGMYSEMATFDEATNVLRVEGFNRKTKQVVMFHLNEFPTVLKRAKAISVRHWETLNKRSDQLQKEYLEIQNRLMLDDAESIEKEIISDLEKETQQFKSQPKPMVLRGFKSDVSDRLYLLQQVIPQ